MSDVARTEEEPVKTKTMSQNTAAAAARAAAEMDVKPGDRVTVRRTSGDWVEGMVLEVWPGEIHVRVYSMTSWKS